MTGRYVLLYTVIAYVLLHTVIAYVVVASNIAILLYEVHDSYSVNFLSIQTYRD